MLKICKYPETFSKGLEDRFNPQVERHLNHQGLRCEIKTLWPDLWVRYLLSRESHLFYRLFHDLLAPLCNSRHLFSIRASDVVWMTGPSLPFTDTHCWFEKKVIQRGASYIFWMEDDWFSDPRMKALAEARVPLAHLVVAVTPALCDRIAGLYPGKPVLLLEEPVDVERLSPKESPQETRKPIVIWSGRPWNVKKLLSLNDILRRVFQDTPFILRIITGVEKPRINLSIPWEWFPYNRYREAEYSAGAVAGLAPLEDTPFNAAKGNYTVKSYMALGVPPLTSPVGYNNRLIKNGETGFLLNSKEDWESALRSLLKDTSFALKTGKAARSEIIQRYSYEALMPIWAKALQTAFPAKLSPGLSSLPAEEKSASVRRPQETHAHRQP